MGWSGKASLIRNKWYLMTSLKAVGEKDMWIWKRENVPHKRTASVKIQKQEWVDQCNRLNVCIPPNTYVEALIFNVMVSGGGPLGGK